MTMHLVRGMSSLNTTSKQKQKEPHAYLLLTYGVAMRACVSTIYSQKISQYPAYSRQFVSLLATLWGKSRFAVDDIPPHIFSLNI